MNSTDFNIDMVGNFDFVTSYKDLSALVKEYKLSLKNNQDSLRDYYLIKTTESYTGESYQVNYFATLKDINPILQFIDPSISVSKNSTVQGSFHSGYTSIFTLLTSFDSVSFDQTTLFNTNLDLSASKVRDSTDILAMAYLYSENQIINEVTSTNSLTLDAVWDNNHIDFNFNIEQEELANYADIYGTIDLLSDSTLIHIKPSDIKALDETWKIDDKNSIISKGREIAIKDLKFNNKDQSIELNGLISEQIENSLTMEINQVKLENINPLINRNLSGIANGYISLNNLYHNFLIDSRINIGKMKINEFLVGDISGISKWHTSDKHFDVELNVKRESKDIINVIGTYQPFLEKNSLDLDATFDQANLKIIEPFIETIFSSISGTVSGEFSVTGTPLFPSIQGVGKVADGRVRVNYLNTLYQLDGNVAFTESSIIMRNILVTDAEQNQATLSGEFTHNGFRDFALSLNGSLNNFQVLNTTSKDNDLFYGTGFVTGEVNFSGPISNLLISAKAQTNKGTRLFIPIGNSGGSIENKDFINFVDFSKSDSSLEYEIENKKINLKGLAMDFDLDITPDAYYEMIFDIQSGDIIRGRGIGKIKLQIDTKGDFNMIGDYEFVSGGYNFTLYNIINKEFSILPKSSISWAGDPYEGILNLRATYSQLASLSPLFNESRQFTDQDLTISDSPEIKRRYPTEVILDLTGPLLSPNIEFDIEIKDYPENIVVAGQSFSLGSLVSSFENRIHSDEQELKRQVFSLLILRNFSSQNQLVTGGSFGSSVSEFLSNQLSYWITQVDENLDIDVDLGQLDQEGFNAFQLRLSYTFLDGRLRITRDGGFTDTENNANISSIAGDWTVEYALTPEGKFRVKMYNRNNTSLTSQALNQTSTFTAGISLMHTQSFNEIKDIFNKSRKQRLNQKEIPDGDSGQKEEFQNN